MENLKYILYFLQWRQNGHDGVSNHQPHDCLLNRLFRRTSKKTSRLRVTGRCEGNSPVTGEFPAQMASNAENVFIWWRHHEYRGCWFSSHGGHPAGSRHQYPRYWQIMRNILMSATKGSNQELLSPGLLWLDINHFKCHILSDEIEWNSKCISIATPVFECIKECRHSRMWKAAFNFQTHFLEENFLLFIRWNLFLGSSSQWFS